MKHAHVLNEVFAGQSAFFNTMVPEFIGMTYRPMLARIKPWYTHYGATVREYSDSRAEGRIAGYLDPEEVARVRKKLKTKDNASIRFGVRKTGFGYTGERGDFCLIGGSIRKEHLSIFYRRLELIGGFLFDIPVIDQLALDLGLTFRSVQIFAVQADVYALAGPDGGPGEKQRLFEFAKDMFS